MISSTWGSFGLGLSPEQLFLSPPKNGKSGTVSPAIDLIDAGDHYLLSAEMPGLKPESVQVSTENRMLLISGHRELPGGQEGKAMYRERRAIHYRRQVALGDTVDIPSIEATYRNGVLEVRLPKCVTARSREIPVNAGAS